MDIHLTAFKRYIKLLYKQNDLNSCIEQAILLTEQYPNDVYALEWICKIYCENYGNAQNESCIHKLRSSINDYAEKLLNLNANSGLAFLIKAFNSYEQKQYVAARTLLQKALNSQPNYEVALELLAKTEMEIGAYAMAIPLWQQLNKTEQIEYVICLSHTQNENQLQQAVNLIQKLGDASDEWQEILARCYMKLKQHDKLKELNLNTLAKAEFIL